MNIRIVKAYFSVLGIILIVAGGVMELLGSTAKGNLSNRWTGNQHEATITGYSVIFFGIVFLLIWFALENTKVD